MSFVLDAKQITRKGTEMSLLDSVFGAGAQAGLLGQSQQANQAFNQAYNNYQSQGQLGQQQSLSNAFQKQMVNWNQNPYATTSAHQWVFNNKPCTLNEFADAIWGKEEHPDKMLFILANSGPQTE